MKLIIERLHGDIYIYRAENKHYNIIKKDLKNRLDPSILDHECGLALNENMAEDFYMVFDIKNK